MTSLGTALTSRHGLRALPNPAVSASLRQSSITRELAESAIKKAQCDVRMTNKSDKPSNKPVPPVHQENGRNPCPAMVADAVLRNRSPMPNSLLTGNSQGISPISRIL